MSPHSLSFLLLILLSLIVSPSPSHSHFFLRFMFQTESVTSIIEFPTHSKATWILKTETSLKMNTYNMVKQEFIKKWITTLHKLDSSTEHPMNVTERRNAIRLSSDTAIAEARSGATIWSRALISRNGNKTTNKQVARCRILKKTRNRMKNRCKTLGRNRNSTAKMRMRKRTELLKSLVPGGELIDDKDYLIRETLDYIVYLRAQVDVMRTVASINSIQGTCN